MDSKFDLREDWISHPDALEHLMQMAVDALVDEDDESTIELLGEVDLLIENRLAEIARLVTQAALHRVVHGPATPSKTDVRVLLGADHYDQIRNAAQSQASISSLRASSLQAAGRIASFNHQYDVAFELYVTSASIWNALGLFEAEAMALLRAGASAHYLGNLKQAMKFSTQARDAFSTLREVRGRILATLNMAQTAQAQGDLDKVEELVESSRELASSIRDGHINASVLIAESILLAERGDLQKAYEGFAKAYRSAKRRTDIEQELFAAKNLARAANDLGDSKRSLRWWSITAEIAEQAGDQLEHQGAQRSRGVLLAELGRYEESIAAFQSAVELNEACSNLLGTAQSRADLGATLLNYALSDDIDDAEFEDLSTRAKSVLSSAREDLEGLEDFEWASISVRNLRVAWILRNEESQGAEILSLSAARFEAVDPTYYFELLRNAAWLRLASEPGERESDQTVEATDWLMEGVTASLNNPVDRAWALAREAATLAASSHPKVALRVFDQALAEIDADSHPSVFGNILNDSALVAADLEELTIARERLLTVLEIGVAVQDRALQTLAFGNLGETALRADDLEHAREYFAEAAKLAAELGDLEQEAIAYASIANVYLQEERVNEAEEAAQRADATAKASGSVVARTRAQSSLASVAYSVGDFELAYETWTQCSAQSSRGGTEYQAFALDSLAQVGDWPRFRRVLDRFAKQAQRTRTQFEFVEKLRLPATTWWRRGNVRGTGVILAYGVLLSIEAASQIYGMAGRKLSSVERQQAVFQVAQPAGAVAAFFVLLEPSEHDLAIARNAFERTIRTATGDGASQLIELVDHLLGNVSPETETTSGRTADDSWL